MATKPTVSTEWATQFTNAGSSGNPNKDEPTQAFKDFGQPEALPVDRQSLNYELNALDQWRRYFEEKTDDLSRPATTTIQGLVELATNAESQVGTDTSRVITPSSMSHKLETLGLGTENLIDSYAGNDADNLPYTGRFFLVNAQNAPDTGNWFIDYAFTNGNNFSTGIQYAVQTGTEKIYFRRSISSVWQPWLELYHTGNNIDARQFGFGTSFSDKNNDTVAGTQFFRTTNVSGGTIPAGSDPLMTIHMERVVDKESAQFLIQHGNVLTLDDPFCGFRFRDSTGTWSDFFELVHTGSIEKLAASTAEAHTGVIDDKIMTPLKTRQAFSQWGLGSEAAKDVSDWNMAIQNGFYRSVGSNSYINSPDDSASGWQGIVSSLDSNSKRQLLWRAGGSNYQIWIREGFSGSWTPWIQLITEHNIGAYIPNQVTWEKRTSASLPINSKNFLDIDTVSTFTLPELSLANDMDFVTIRPSTSNKTPANFTFTINCFAGDSMRTRDLDKNIVSDTTLTVDLMTEITFIKNGGFWEY